MSEQARIETAIDTTIDNCEVLRARLAKYEDADGRPLRAVVLPEPLKRGDEGGSGEYGAAMIRGYTACLREVARLNSSPVTDNGDAYQGAREDLAIWKRRALEAETKVREQDQIIENLGNALNDENGPTFMGEPVLKARAALTAPSHGEQVRQMVPEPVRDALARRCLWLAFCWNDHNFGPAHEEARKEALKHGIDSFDAANEWLAAAPSAGSQEKG